MSMRDTLVDPIFKNNPIALQILGICSALAVTTSLRVTVVMCIALTLVTAFSSFFISSLMTPLTIIGPGSSKRPFCSKLKIRR